MAIFRRRSVTPGPFTNYVRYRPFVREDFLECCAYCLLHEILGAGKEGFELDHFRPKSHKMFAHLSSDFYNLYYSCHVCNRYKSNRWPTQELATRGYGFFDACSESFGSHFEESDDGEWIPLTPIGEYTESKLRLNRAHLVGVRALLRRATSLKGLDPIDWNAPCRQQLARILS